MIFIGLYREVNKMNRKIIGISIVLLLLAIIPSTSIATEIQAHDPEYLFLLGTIVIDKIENNSIYGLAIRLRYFELCETERTLGIITLNRVIVGSNFIYIPIIGKLHFIIGIDTGGIEVE